MPIAFIFRVRANHEYGVMVCLLIALLGLELSRRRRWAIWLVAMGFAWALLIKGLFVFFVAMAAVLWLIVNPTGGQNGRRGQVVSLIVALSTTLLIAKLYDLWYLRVTGVTFWRQYWHVQFAPYSTSDVGIVGVCKHAVFYISRFLWHAAPWTLLSWRCFTRADCAVRLSRYRRLGVFVVLFAGSSMCLLSLSPRVAERYVFYATYLIGVVAAVASVQCWTALRRVVARTDGAMVGIAALVWLALVAVRVIASYSAVGY
jgi:hypothetical protein